MDESDAPIITIAGERVLLGPPARSQLPLFERWENDLPLSILTGDVLRPLSREAIERHLAWVFAPPDDGLTFTIYERPTRRPRRRRRLWPLHHRARRPPPGGPRPPPY